MTSLFQASTSALGKDVAADGKWIVSAQSPLQQRIVSRLPDTTCYYVDGPLRVYVMDKRVQYFVLSTDPSPLAADEVFLDQRRMHDFSDPSKILAPAPEEDLNIHQQADQTIIAMGVFEESTRDLASAWINHLQKENRNLQNAHILFRMKGPTELQVADSASSAS